MPRIANDTPGLICVDVPPVTREQVDPMASLLGSFDFSEAITTETAIKMLVLDRMGERIAQAQAVQARRDAAKRARDTLDLYPSYQGEGQPERYTEVSDEVWDRVKTMPVIQQQLDTRQLRVV